ncbi:MAG TPA: 2Fe-2S iron-sulfur cluster-binding protein, partial [Anaerolineales bacterium]|nr:2Fe-2S iron-sulfur cluster-binding protein [Anaerolineales bacterium]
MADSITLKIDGHSVTVPAGTLIVEAAKRADNDIPVFCYHPKLEPVGMCRMCLVEVGTPLRDRESGELQLDEHGEAKINWMPKLQTACTVPVSAGMQVRSASEKVTRARKDVVEFLLTSHPLDCPVCDKGGECPLQNLTMRHGPGKSRYLFDEKMQLQKRVPLGDLIFLDRERCIQCARCTRFQDELVGEPVIGFDQRGRALQIVTFSEPGFDSHFSGNTTDICPVGALTSADFRFGARPWELQHAPSICPHCAVGCNLHLNTRCSGKGGEAVIKRIMPRQNEKVNEIWLCDKGRFGHHFVGSAERLTTPLLRKDGQLSQASWEQALQLV